MTNALSFLQVSSTPFVLCHGLTNLRAGADIQFRRHHRLDVCLVKNHNIALSVSSLTYPHGSPR